MANLNHQQKAYGSQKNRFQAMFSNHLSIGVSEYPILSHTSPGLESQYPWAKPQSSWQGLAGF
jgi:hypothetical protein